MELSQSCSEEGSEHIIWEVCYEDLKNTNFECGLNICQECLLNWILTRINKDLLKEEIVIPCPKNKCDHPISINDMYKNLTKEYFDAVLDQLCDVYVCNQKDIRKWPNSECINAGIINQKSCQEKLICELWGYTWKDVTQLTLRDKIYKSIFGSYSINSELLSYISEIIRGEPWPQWGIIIFKTGGWPHILCQKWSYEFCWDWLGYYKDYKHMGDTTWPLRLFMIYPLTFFCVWWLDLKLSFSFEIIEYLEKLLIYITFMVALSSLMLSSSLIEIYFINKMKRLQRFRPKYRGIQYKINLFSIGVYPILWIALVMLAYWSPLTNKIVVFMAYEAVAIALFCALGYLSFYAYQNLFKIAP